ncbi:MAG: PDZ domain-containing protein [Myxococcota bacterium]|nr:PDZ domain-containing protein [Myxococcota bacterium]
MVLFQRIAQRPKANRPVWRMAYAPICLVVAAVTAFANPAQSTRQKENERLVAFRFERHLEGQERVSRLFEPLRIAAAPFCGERTVPVLGLYAISTDFYAYPGYHEFQLGIQDQYALGEQPRVMYVVPGLAADRAGIKAGDLIIQLDGREVKRKLALERWANKNPDRRHLTLTVAQRTGRHTLEVEVNSGCAIEGHFNMSPMKNAYQMFFGDYTGVYLNEGLLRSMPSDESLAVIAGHELAHFILVSGSSERTEAEADYLGLYIAALAGYPLTSAKEIWDEWARQDPFSTIEWGVASSHPQTAQRAIEFEQTVAEIKAKQADGYALTPNLNRWSLDRPQVSKKEVKARNEVLRQEALSLFRMAQQRTADVAYRLAVAGAPVCDADAAPVFGAMVGRDRDFSVHQKAQIQDAFGVGKDVTVFAVAKGSPADKAGVQVNDVILSINGSRVKRLKDVFKKVSKSKKKDPVLRVRRDQEVIDITMERVVGCPYGSFLKPSDSLDVFEDRRNRETMIIPSGLLSYIGGDEELAIEISHQMGHNILRSYQDPEDEKRADKLGLQIASLAGYDVTKAHVYWDEKSAHQWWQIAGEMTSQNVVHGEMALRAHTIRKFVSEELHRLGAEDSVLIENEWLPEADAPVESAAGHAPMPIEDVNCSTPFELTLACSKAKGPRKKISMDGLGMRVGSSANGRILFMMPEDFEQLVDLDLATIATNDRFNVLIETLENESLQAVRVIPLNYESQIIGYLIEFDGNAWSIVRR